jgi:hemolysin type calcium-binding protein
MRSWALLVVLLAAALAAQAAQASSFSGGSFVAAPGERNDVTITLADGRYTARDAGAQLDAPGCDRIDAHSASCAASDDGHWPPMTVDLGDGDDVLHADDGADVIEGGDGNDEIHGGGGADDISGGPGNDLLEGGGGDTTGRYDSIANGASLGIYNDVLDGGPGADTLEGGGGGYDRADYSMRSAPLTITLDGVANDGEAGEGDNVEPDVEDVRAGSGDDVLIGDSGPNALEGGEGNDLIDGRGGYQDLADGGDGNDVLKLLDGGIEALRGIDGPIPGFKFDDLARCDSWALGAPNGDDTAYVDPTDAGQAGQLSLADPPCEHVVMAAAPQSLPVRDGRVTLPVACGAGPTLASCKGKATVRLPKRARRFGPMIAARDFRTHFGHRSKARAKLNRKGRRAVTRHRRIRAWVVYNYMR